jgi:hypothetical protein
MSWRHFLGMFGIYPMKYHPYRYPLKDLGTTKKCENCEAEA